MFGANLIYLLIAWSDSTPYGRKRSDIIYFRTICLEILRKATNNLNIAGRHIDAWTLGFMNMKQDWRLSKYVFELSS
jgi:hypothetical protein